mmetsp:Transcript_46531/g.108494  ORF Transcript_46531/g.108494 Transcript_46531/m.108494 type:complete len:87 (+) Transcript_46531:368-628(+)
MPPEVACKERGDEGRLGAEVVIVCVRVTVGDDLLPSEHVASGLSKGAGAALSDLLTGDCWSLLEFGLPERFFLSIISRTWMPHAEK